MKTDIIEDKSECKRDLRNNRALKNPLDYIVDDHLSMRVRCVELDQIATMLTPSETALSEMLSYLKDDLSLLLADEEEMLLPLVMARAEPEDDMPLLVERLEREHQEIIAILKRVIVDLEKACLTQIMSWELRDDLKTLANATRRHLILENAVLLPLARARLTSVDLDRLQLSMLKRRGLDALLKT